MNKKLILFFIIFCITLSAYTQKIAPLLEMRNRFFEESNNIKSLLSTSKDPGIIINLWNSCMTTVLQLNAYFYMLNIFDSVKSGTLNDDPTMYLSMWLKEIKNVNQLNIKNLENSIKNITDSNTKTYIDRLKVYYLELNKKIDEELVKLGALKQTLPIKNKRR